MVFAASWALGFSQGDELVGKHRQDDSFICLTSDNQEKRRFVRQVLVERTMGIIERIPEIACPECKSELAEGIDLRCTGCDKHYEIQKGIPYMILDDMVSYFGYIAYPVFGFPDMVSLFKFVPFKPFAAAAMMWLDKVISHIPFVRTQSWVILLKGTALETPLLT